MAEFLEMFKFRSQDGITHSMYEFLSNFTASYTYFANGVQISEENLDCLIGEYWNEANLEAMTNAIIAKVQGDAIVIADSYNYSLYPETSYEIYNIGGETHTYLRNRSAGKHFEIPITDIKAWIGSTRVKTLSAEEKDYMKKFK